MVASATNNRYDVTRRLEAHGCVLATPPGCTGRSSDPDRRTYSPFCDPIIGAIFTETIDTTTSGGKLIFHIFGALAEFERDIIRERTQAGLTAARARGRKGSRPKALTPKRAAQLQTLYNDKNRSIAEICRTLNISRATLYRYLKPSYYIVNNDLFS